MVIATPDHWHALQTIWACQAGKDVYVEKPISYTVDEGRKMVEAARKYNRVVQVGMQSRSNQVVIEAMKLLHDGYIGDIYMAKGLCYKPRDSIGRKKDAPIPKGVHWDLFLGPAPYRPFNPNRFHYNWHWFWDTGTTDMGNQGVHEMDKARWGMNKRVHPVRIHGTGGYFVWDSDQETPNTQITTFEYEDGKIRIKVRKKRKYIIFGKEYAEVEYEEKGVIDKEIEMIRKAREMRARSKEAKELRDRYIEGIKKRIKEKKRYRPVKRVERIDMERGVVEGIEMYNERGNKIGWIKNRYEEKEIKDRGKKEEIAVIKEAEGEMESIGGRSRFKTRVKRIRINENVNGKFKFRKIKKARELSIKN